MFEGRRARVREGVTGEEGIEGILRVCCSYSEVQWMFQGLIILRRSVVLISRTKQARNGITT
jgi:hypothetical protein